MTTLLSIGVSNFCIALVLAALAFALQHSKRHPAIAHLLWVLVLIKLITPAFITIPIVPVPASSAQDTQLAAPSNAPLALDIRQPSEIVPAYAAASSSPFRLSSASALVAILILGCIGSIAILIASLVRIARFHRLLNESSQAAPPHINQLAASIARQLHLARRPVIQTTTAHISPMVWWTGSHVRIILPDSLIRDCRTDDLRWVLAHELAHVRRRDYLVRWLEWLACVLLWWNPLTWIARHNLRISEEICCDALVIDILKPDPRNYAGALLSAIELLAAPVIRPPAIASEINSGGILERRFDMIVSKHSTNSPGWMRAGIITLALGLLPVGVAYGQDYEAIGRRLKEAVNNGELSSEQARTMMHALKQTTVDAVVARDFEVMDTHGVDDHHLDDVRADSDALLSSGRMSKQDAQRRLAEMEAARAAHQAARVAQQHLENASAVRARAHDALTELHEVATADSFEAVRAHRMHENIEAVKEVEFAKALKERTMAEQEIARQMERMRGKMKPVKALDMPAEESYEKYKDMHTDLKKAVETGSVSREEAVVKAAEMNAMMELEKRKHLESEHPRPVDLTLQQDNLAQAMHAARQAQEKTAAQLRALEQQIRELQEKHIHLQKLKQAQQERSEEVDWKRVMQRVEAAVESGEMTPEEADEFYAALKSRLERR